jgi:hypothetical protein
MRGAGPAPAPCWARETWRRRRAPRSPGPRRRWRICSTWRRACRRSARRHSRSWPVGAPWFAPTASTAACSLLQRSTSACSLHPVLKNTTSQGSACERAHPNISGAQEEVGTTPHQSMREVPAHHCSDASDGLGLKTQSGSTTSMSRRRPGSAPTPPTAPPTAAASFAAVRPELFVPVRPVSVSPSRSRSPPRVRAVPSTSVSYSSPRVRPPPAPTASWKHPERVSAKLE